MIDEEPPEGRLPPRLSAPQEPRPQGAIGLAHPMAIFSVTARSQGFSAGIATLSPAAFCDHFSLPLCPSNSTL